MEEALTALELYNMGKNYLAIRNYKEAQRYLIKAVAKGSGKAGRDLMKLAQIYYKNGDAEAMPCLETLANHGSTEACLLLGEIYRDGITVRRNLDLAFEYFAEAYRLGSAHGAYEAGMMIWPDVYRDEEARSCAKEWFRAAIEEGYVPGYTQMGLLFCDEDPTHITEALDWFRQGGEKGDTLAMIYAANIYLEGTGVPQNISMGLKLLEQAAEAGNAKANVTLGDFYQLGQYVKKDRIKAQEYYQRARECDYE